MGVATETKRVILVLFSSFVGFLGSLVRGRLSWELQAGVRQLGAQVALKPACPCIQLLIAEEPGE